MNSETKNCQNCKNDFILGPEDFNFYEKVKVPPSTFCPECKKQRRLAFRNTHALYKRKDSFSGKDVISIYSPDKELVVIDQRDWWGDSWDPFDYAHEYDFSLPFFTQWKKFRDVFPFQNLSNSKAVNSDYCNVAEESKDSYLCSASWNIERTFYSDAMTLVKDSMDLHVAHRMDFCYEDINCLDSYKLFYSQDCASCVESFFLYDCRGCTNCFMSSGLRNKSYVMFNEQLSKEEYQTRMEQMDFGSFDFIQKSKEAFKNLKQQGIHKFAHITNSQNVTGNNINQAKNCKNCFDISDNLEDCKNLVWGVKNVKNVFDAGPGIGLLELCYESFDAGAGGGTLLFDSVVYYSNNVEYSFNCYSSSYLFACIGLRGKQYCIFNKQYTKETYFEMVDKIKQHMNDMPFIDQVGRIYKYGEFFPIELSPFCYNETVAQDYFPLTKEEALTKGYTWKDKEDRNYSPTIKNENIPDAITEIPDSFVNEVIECAHKGECTDRCTTAFKITANELTFYKRFSIPIPRICYGCRHYARLRERNPMKLWTRQCMCDKSNHAHQGKCEIEFETSYAPERPEAVYCEKCYQQEIY